MYLPLHDLVYNARRRPAAPSWQPSDEASLIAHGICDPNNATYLDTNGSNVNAVLDQSGNSNPFDKNGTNAYRPVTGGSLGGASRHAITFDGSNDNLRADGLTALNEWHFFVLMNTGTDAGQLMGTAGSWYANMDYSGISTTGVGGGSDTFTSGNQDNAVHLFDLYYRADTTDVLEGAVDGTVEASTTPTGDANTTGFFIGSNGQVNSFGAPTLAEIMVFSDFVTRQTVVDYVNDQWSLSL